MEACYGCLVAAFIAVKMFGRHQFHLLCLITSQVKRPWTRATLQSPHTHSSQRYDQPKVVSPTNHRTQSFVHAAPGVDTLDFLAKFLNAQLAKMHQRATRSLTVV